MNASGSRIVCTAWLAMVLVVLASGRAGAQNVGEALKPLDVRVFANEVYIGFDSDFTHYVRAEELGGVSLFASLSPAGPVLGRFFYPPPFSEVLEGVGGVIFPNVPPGTYYITAIYGPVSAPSVPATDWTRVDVATAVPCSAPPAQPYVRNENVSAGSSTVRLFFGNVLRCSTSFLVEAGTTPWLANAATFESFSQLFVSNAVPPGAYYVRIRGRNAQGASPYSELVSFSVPDCQAQAPGLTTLSAQVTGNTVTLSWTTSTPPGLPVTFREVHLEHLATPAAPLPPVVPLPGSGTSFSAAVPPGQYQVFLGIGNACGKTYSNRVSFTVP